MNFYEKSICFGYLFAFHPSPLCSGPIDHSFPLSSSWHGQWKHSKKYEDKRKEKQRHLFSLWVKPSVGQAACLPLKPQPLASIYWQLPSFAPSSPRGESFGCFPVSLLNSLQSPVLSVQPMTHVQTMTHKRPLEMSYLIWEITLSESDQGLTSWGQFR